MARACMVTGIGTARGNHVAHCNKKVKRAFKANVRWKRFWVESENRWVTLRINNRGMRTIDKKGIDAVLETLRQKGEQV